MNLPGAFPSSEASGKAVAASDRWGRWGFVLGSLVVGISVSGFLMGISERVEPSRPSLRKQALRSLPITEQPLTVPRYAEIDSSQLGVNREWRSDLTKLNQKIPGLLEPVPRTPELKLAALRDRQRTRAFDGAPPAIPHTVDARSAESCLGCHARGMFLGEKMAPRMCHPTFTNCVQCHIPQQAQASQSQTSVRATPTPEFSQNAPPATELANYFLGTQRSGPGLRLAPGAPPTIPHTLQMRDDCLSCHGLVARAGLRTTHPWLQNCCQCHAANGDNERGQPPVSP